MKKLSYEQWIGIIRHILTFVGGILVMKGVFTEGYVSDISGAVMSLVAIIWSIVSKSDVSEPTEPTL